MKGLKKLLTGILAATLIMGSSLTVYAGEDTNTDPAPAAAAADTSATITITPKATIVNEVKKGTVESITYTYYQVLRATAPKGEVTDDTAISYYLNNKGADVAMKDLLVGTGKFTATLSADGSRWIMTSSETDGEAMRNALNTAAIKDAALSTSTFSYDKTAGKATSGNLDIGYYLIESSLGSVVALQTVGHVEIEEKNDYITTVKTVSKTSWNVGDKVPYTAEVFIPTSTKVNTENDPSIVILHDTMEKDKLAFKNDVTAKIGDAEFNGFSVATSDLKDATCTFEVSIPVTADLLGKTIVFSYSAEITSEAADADGFVNELFGEYNGYKTEPSKPVVYTYGFNADKEFVGYTGTENWTADFEIRTAADNADTAISFVKIGNTLNYRKAHSGETGSTTVTLNKNDVSNFYGLDDGTYYLVEKATNAPGYNILTAPVAVKIEAVKDANGKATAEWKVIVDNKEAANKTVVINNTKGTMLPSTGGIGTTIFYIIGSLLIVAGVAYFIVRRKANAE